VSDATHAAGETPQLDETQPASARPAWFPRYRGMAFGLTFKWLLFGALLYALLLLVMVAGFPDDTILPFFGPSFYLTAAFGLPYVLRTVHRPGRTRRILYFFVALPLAHMAAIYLAWRHGVPNALPGEHLRPALESGAIGGITGATLAFTALRLLRLSRRQRSDLWIMAVATLVLTGVGAAGVALGASLYDATGGAPLAIERQILGLEAVHLPWQGVFALPLAMLTRPAPEG